MLAGGPIGLDEIVPYLSAGAVAVNLGTSLAPPALVGAKSWQAIAKLVESAVSTARAHIEESEEHSPVVH